MTRSRSPGVLMLVISLLILMVAAGPASAQEQVYDETFPLSSWAELNMQMDEGSSIVWDVETTGSEEIYLDLHSHANGQEEYHEQFEATSGETGSFTASSVGQYSLYLQNLQEDDVEVRMQVRGDFEVESEENIDSTGETNGSSGPGLVFLTGAVAALAASARRRRPSAPLGQ